MSEESPVRDERHHALDVFCGEWRAEGTSYGGTDQSGDPKADGETWASTHSARWHSGKFFLVQDERAVLGGQKTFDTLSIFGVDTTSGDHFVRTFDNNGYYRNYTLEFDGSVWTLIGSTERAQIEFSDSNRKQTITWEWKPSDRWLPLCDRVAVRTD